MELINTVMMDIEMNAVTPNCPYLCKTSRRKRETLVVSRAAMIPHQR